jgi:hypothetical protein
MQETSIVSLFTATFEFSESNSMRTEWMGMGLSVNKEIYSVTTKEQVSEL